MIHKSTCQELPESLVQVSWLHDVTYWIQLIGPGKKFATWKCQLTWFLGLQFQLKQLALALSTWSNLRRAGRKPSVGKTQVVHLEKVLNRNLLICVSSQGSVKYFIYVPFCHCLNQERQSGPNPPKIRSKGSQSMSPFSSSCKTSRKNNMKISNTKWLPLWLHPLFWYGHSLPFFGPPSPWFHDRASKSACTPMSPPQRAPCEWRALFTCPNFC